MDIHTAIGGIITLLLAILACLGAMAVIVAFLRYYLDGPGWEREIDVVGSQYVSADGNRFDWTKGDAVNNGTPRNARAKNEDDDPEGWKDVEYDEGNFEIVPAQGETRLVKSDMDLEIDDAEIIDDGNNRS